MKKFRITLIITLTFVTLHTGVAFANPCNPDGFFKKNSDYIEYYELQEITRKLQKEENPGNEVNNEPAEPQEELRPDDPGIRNLAGLFNLVNPQDSSTDLKFPAY